MTALPYPWEFSKTNYNEQIKIENKHTCTKCTIQVEPIDKSKGILGIRDQDCNEMFKP